ncbi:alcohol dehydrogenase [Mycena floridula]|nr:alcohol dehydrogenase [Mycena floridula]
MRGFYIQKLGHPSTQTVQSDVPEPVAAPDEVIIDVYSAALNFFDILQSQGKYQIQPPLPFVLGSEFAGRIAKDSPIPKGCPFKPGDRVFGAAQGAYADKLKAKWTAVLPLPDAVSFDHGASLYVTWPTSYEALKGRAQLKAGEWVLVTAAAGGVGIAAVQIAKVLGAKVIAAAGSSEKLEVARRYGGADHLIDYSKPNWQKEVLKLTGGKGVDVIYDPVGLIKDSLKCIAWKGRALVIGFAGGKIEQVPMNLVLLKNISLVGLHWGAYFRNEPDHASVVWKEVLELLTSGKLKPVTFPDVFPLEKIADGLAAIEQRKTWGKIIARIREPEKAKL